MSGNYQSVGTPMIVCSYSKQLIARGMVTKDDILFTHNNDAIFDHYEDIEQSLMSVFNLKPSISKYMVDTEQENSWLSIKLKGIEKLITNKDGTLNTGMFPNFCAILGHNMKSAAYRSWITIHNETQNLEWSAATDGSVHAGININANTHSAEARNGFTTMGMSYGYTYKPYSIGDELSIKFVALLNEGTALEFPTIGSALIGYKYEFPYSPDLSCTISRDYDYDVYKSHSGSRFSTGYGNNPFWLNNTLEPWSLTQAHQFETSTKLQTLGGARSWKISFTMLDEEDMFAENTLTTTLSEMGVAGENANYASIATSDSFMRVLYHTDGGRLPFLFCANKQKEKYPDNWAICRMDMKSFAVRQIADKKYNITLDIYETW
ncbi:MAG: hypothetical protein Unbinned2514contig1001_1 [Prokaryotic dsDNA virus sp.]|nr:MAG: hypothetical protein Unbinned2514contig1001_1 [Prokaryotic dsDNA virus sp.]|tara:strand:- start:378 stop:1511 length:1134 start_codon:yes stop_codon:yes gene_type:complete